LEILGYYPQAICDGVDYSKTWKNYIRRYMLLYDAFAMVVALGFFYVYITGGLDEVWGFLLQF